MAEQVTQTTITQAPEYLRPGIEKFLDLSVAQAGDAIDTSKFAPSVVGLGALQQQAQQSLAYLQNFRLKKIVITLLCLIL